MPDTKQVAKSVCRICHGGCAVRLHLENRVLVYGNKTVVFD